MSWWHCNHIILLADFFYTFSLDSKPTTALITTLDGTMYMVDRQESGSMKVIWAFSTGAPIYYSYKAPIKKDIGKENVSAALISGFVECGEDWALYMHDKQFGKKVLVLRLNNAFFLR